MNEVVHTSPTIGSNVEEIVVKNTHFLMWDIGGQESLRSSWNTYYSNTEVFQADLRTLTTGTTESAQELDRQYVRDVLTVAFQQDPFL